MANRVFQGVVYQMKDAIDRMVGVVDETGTMISCSDLNRIGEVRDGIASDRLTAGDSFVRDGYTYHLFTSNKRNDYAVVVEGTDDAAARYAALLAISLQNICLLYTSWCWPWAWPTASRPSRPSAPSPT